MSGNTGRTTQDEIAVNWKGNLLILEMGVWQTFPPTGEGEGVRRLLSLPPPPPPLLQENIMEIVNFLCQMQFKRKQLYIEFRERKQYLRQFN